MPRAKSSFRTSGKNSLRFRNFRKNSLQRVQRILAGKDNKIRAELVKKLKGRGNVLKNLAILKSDNCGNYSFICANDNVMEYLR